MTLSRAGLADARRPGEHREPPLKRLAQGLDASAAERAGGQHRVAHALVFLKALLHLFRRHQVELVHNDADSLDAGALAGHEEAIQQPQARLRAGGGEHEERLVGIGHDDLFARGFAGAALAFRACGARQRTATFSDCQDDALRLVDRLDAYAVADGRYIRGAGFLQQSTAQPAAD